MPKSVALGQHFERFIAEQVAHGRYNNDSEVVRAGLRLLEKYELELEQLRSRVDEGDRDYTEGRFSVVSDPAGLAQEIAEERDFSNSARRAGPTICGPKRKQAINCILECFNAASRKDRSLSAEECVSAIEAAVYPGDANREVKARKCYDLTLVEWPHLADLGEAPAMPLGLPRRSRARRT